MNKSQLIEAIAAGSGLSKKDSEAALKATLDSIEGALAKGDKVVLVGFGTFEVTKRAARTGRNPQTGKEMKIPASKAPTPGSIILSAFAILSLSAVMTDFSPITFSILAIEPRLPNP